MKTYIASTEVNGAWLKTALYVAGLDNCATVELDSDSGECALIVNGARTPIGVVSQADIMRSDQVKTKELVTVEVKGNVKSRRK